MSKKYLTKDMLLSMNDLPTIEVEVPEWDCTVILKALTAAQINSLSGGIGKKENAEEYFYKIIAMSMVNEQGERLLTDAEAKKLGNHSTPALMRLFESIKKLNHIEDTVDSKKEELEKDPFLSS